MVSSRARNLIRRHGREIAPAAHGLLAVVVPIGIASAAFHCAVAPFLQSIIEVRGERSSRRIRLIPKGNHVPPRWTDRPGWFPRGARSVRAAE